jgi:hypothetical protein
MCCNEAAVNLLTENPDKIDWQVLSSMSEAIHLLEQNPEKIDWFWLSGNDSALHLLEKNQDKIDWQMLSTNPGIFEYDYDRMSRPFKDELIAVVYHPDNVKRLFQFPH